MLRLALPLVPVVLALGCQSTAEAQCPLVFSSGGPQAQLSGGPTCSTQWDPDGAGPLPMRLVIGGTSVTAGSEFARSVTSWDGSQWQALGPGFSGGAVYAITVWNGVLIAGGALPAGGINHVAQWNGSSWQPLGTGVPSTVRALTTFNGNLVAAEYTAGTTVPWIRQWNGSAWSALPAPPLLRTVSDMVSYQGMLCIAGSGVSQGVLERWDGTSWLPSITATTTIASLAVRSFSPTISSLYAGGSFTSIGGVAAQRVAVTTGGPAFTFSAVGPSLPGSCAELHVRAFAFSTAIVVCVDNAAHDVLQLVSGAWAPMGNAQVRSLEYYNGSYHGIVPNGSSEACKRYDGSAWVTVRGAGLDGEVRAATCIGNDVIVGGTFTSTPDGAMSRIARWNGSTFQALGSGVSGTASPSVDALVRLDNGDVVAGGSFDTAGGVAASNIARWNGSVWSPLGSGVNDQVLALAKLPNGDVVAAGKMWIAGGVFCASIARWDGVGWSPLGNGMNNYVHALAVRSDGRLFAGGVFTTAGFVGANRIAQWDGTQWLSLATGMNGDVFGLTVRPNDDLVAVGAFTFAGTAPADRCGRWNGTTWAGMGTASIEPSPVRAAVALPNGDVVVGHGFHTPTPILDEGLAKWNGSTWSAFGTLSTSLSVPPTVRTLVQRADGALIVGGSFSQAPGVVSYNLTRVASTCMPLVQPYGAGCSAAGPLVLTAGALPWAGATFRTTTTGIAQMTLCIGVLGFAQWSVPLPSLLAEGQPGCTLLVSPDILPLVVPDATGTAHTALALPNSPSVLGASFYQQTIPFEFDGLGAIVAVRASNALAVTIGTL